MSRVIVRSVPGAAFRQEIELGWAHRLTADEPTSAGGEGAGPGPYELLLAALGACTSMTVGMYARRKGWPLEGVEVRLAQERVHARDCEDCEDKEGFITLVRREIELHGPLDAEQRARLVEIAGKCPVARTLTNAIRIEDVLVPEAR